jgi:L-ornithine Nalpha-acyltransferase
MSLSAEYIQTPVRTLNPASLEVRLAKTSLDLEAAQRLRYQVFYEEMGATPLAHDIWRRLDTDRFDALCDHLLVIDPMLPKEQSVVGTYRLLPGSRLDDPANFYSASEFDLAPMLANGPALDRLLECGRSCVAKGYRGNRTVQMLWRGIAAYMADHQIEAMFGCASLPGTNAAALAPQLSFLHHQALAPLPLRVTALPERAAAVGQQNCPMPDKRAFLKNLPPLIKAYLRLGAWVGDGASIDHQFDTTDVFVLLPTNRIPSRYYAHFDRPF